jgi:hypothetical protein
MHPKFVREAVGKYRHFYASSGGDAYDADNVFMCGYMQITPVKFIFMCIHLVHRHHIMEAYKGL